MGPQEDYIETVVTCEGDYHDPELHKRLEEFRQSLQDLLYTDGDKLILKKVEPWNSVRVTFKISREAALRLKQLAQQGNATLRQLGVLAVQIQGDQAISLTIAGRNNERTELIIRTDSTPGPPTVSFSDSILPGGEELNSPGPSNVEATRRNIADYLRQGQALQQGSNLVETLFGPGALGQNSDVFRSPNLVASSQSTHSFRSGGAASSSPSTPPSTTAISPSLPYLSTFPQGRSPPGFSQGQAFPGPPISSPGPSSGSLVMKYPTPGFPQQDLGAYLPMDLAGLPPPPPYPHSTAVVNNISRPARTVTASSPLLVNLLQTDPLGVGLNSLTPLKMLPPSGEGGPPPKKKRRPRKKPAATATVTSGSLLEEEQLLPGLASSPVPEPSLVPVPLSAPPSVPVPLSASSSHDAENTSMDDEHPFLNPADPNAVFPPSSHRMSPELPVIPLISSAVELELGLPIEQLEPMDTVVSIEAAPVVSEALVSPVQLMAPMEVDAVEMNLGDGKLVNPVTGDLEVVDPTSDLSPIKEREQAALGMEVPTREKKVLAQTCATTTTSQSVSLSQTVPQPAVTAVQTTVVDSVRIPGLPGTSHPQPSPSSNPSQVPVTCVAQPAISIVQNSLSLDDPALYASSSQQAEVSASVHPATGVAGTHSAPSLPVASSACSPAGAPSVVQTAVSNPIIPPQPSSVMATQSSSAHTPSPSPPDTPAGGQSAVERRREGSVEAKVVVSESMSQPGGSEAVSQTSPSSSKADPYLLLSSPSTRNNSASPNASPDNKEPSEGDENSNHSDSGICNDISPDMGTSQGSLLDSTGNKVYNHDSGIGSSSERSDDTPSEPGDNEYRSSHMGAEKEECSKSQKLVNCKQEAKVITVGYVMNNDHHAALTKDRNDLTAVQELKDRVPNLVRGDESNHGPNQLTVNVVHLAGKDQKNLVEPVKSVAQNAAPSHVFNSQQEPMKNGPQGETKSVPPPSDDVRCRKQVKSPVQPDCRTQNHAHVDEESSLMDSPAQQSNMALAPATSRHLLSNGPVTKSPEEAAEADKHHPDVEICTEQPPPASTLRNDSPQAPDSMELAADQAGHLMPEDEVSEMKEVARLAFSAQLVPEGQAVAVEGVGLLDGRYQARSPREMMEVEGGRTSPTGVGRGRGSPPESLRGSNITSMYSKQSVAVNVNLLNHIYSAGLPPPRRLTESVQRLVKPLPSIDSGMPQMRSCKSPGTTAPKQASSMSGSSPRSIHSGARSPGASARSAVEGKMMNSSAASVSMPSCLPYLQHGVGGPTVAMAYSPGMAGVSVASSTAYAGSPMTLMPPSAALMQGLNQASRSQCEVSQPSMELLERSEGLDSVSTRVVPSILDKPPHVVFSINVSRASDAPVCAVAETVMSSQTATSTCSPQTFSHPHIHLQPLLPKSNLQSNPLPSDPVPSSCNRQCEDSVSRTAGAPLPASLNPSPSSCAMNHNVSSSPSDLGHSTVSHNSSLEDSAGHICLAEPAVTPVSASVAVAPATCHAGVLVGESQSSPKDSGPSQTLPSVQHSTSAASHNLGEVLRTASPVVHPAPIPSTAPPPTKPPLSSVSPPSVSPPSVSLSVSSQAQADLEAMSLGSEVLPPLPPPPPTPPPPPPLPTDPYPHPPSEMDSSDVMECTEVSVSDASGSGSANSSAAASVSRTEETLHLSQTATRSCQDLSSSEADGAPNGSSSGRHSSNLCTSKAAESECDKQTQDTPTAVPATASHPTLVAGQPLNSSHGAPSVQSDPVTSIQPPTSLSDSPAQQVRPIPAPSLDCTATSSARNVPMEIDQAPAVSPAKKVKVEKLDSVSSVSSVQVSQAPTVAEEAVRGAKASKLVSHVTKTSPKGPGVKSKGSTVAIKSETAPPASVDVEMTPDLRQSEGQGNLPSSTVSPSSCSSSRGPAQAASEKGAVPLKVEQAVPTPPGTAVAPLPASAGKAGQNGTATKATAAPQTPAASPTGKTGSSPKATSKGDPAGASSAKQPPAQAQKDGSQQEGKKTVAASSGPKTRESPDLLKKEPAASATGSPSATAAKSTANLPPLPVSKPSESAPAPSPGNTEEQHAERPVRMTRKRRRTQSDSEPEHTPTPLPTPATASTTTTIAAPSTSSSTASAPSNTSTSTPALAAALMAPTLMDTKPDVAVSSSAVASETEKTASPSTEGQAVGGMRLRETRRNSSGSEAKHKSSTEESSESTAGEKTAVEKNAAERASGEKTMVEKSPAEKHAEKNAAEKQAAENNSSDKTAAEKGSAEKMDGASKEEELGRKAATGRRQRIIPSASRSYFETLIMQGRTRSQSAPKGEKEKDKDKEQNQPPPPAPPKEDAAAAVTATTATAAAAAAAASASDSLKRPTRALRQKDPPEQPAAKRRRPRDPR